MNQPQETPPPPTATAAPRTGGTTLRRILIALVVIVAALVGLIAMQPSTLNIQRSTTIAAPPQAVFEQLNDFHQWNDWSPWARLDPQAKNAFEGPAAGEGAVFRWSGNAEVGEGSMTIVESRPPEHVKIDLRFVRPFEDKATVEFHLRPEADQTSVTWSMAGENNFLGKAMCLIFDMEEMVGGQYEKGLANLKAKVEGATAGAAAESQAAEPASVSP